MNKKYLQIIDELGADRILQNEPLSLHCTFKIGGPSDLFYVAKTEEEIIKAVLLARKFNISYFILGGGSNTLVSDEGFRGLVIKNEISSLELSNLDKEIKVIAGAGLKLSVFLGELLKNSLSGLEFMVGIPGTVGGAIRGNAGAFGELMGDKVIRVKILSKEGRIDWVNKEDCQFDYRESRFKHNDEIILKAEFLLEKTAQKEIAQKIAEYLNKRNGLPKEPSAGCVFVNPKPLGAGALIDQCNLKGKKIGNAIISEKHANFIVNTGGAKAKDVINLALLIKEKVKEKFGIELKEEIVLLGFDK